MTVVIGVGNPGRGDDGAGRAVARRLRALSPPGVEVRECEGEATGLIAAWEGAEEVVLVDACQGAGPPGSVHRLDPDALGSLESLRHASTHSFGVAAALGLSRVLGRLPPRLAIYAIEGRRFPERGGLSPEADRAANEVVAILVRTNLPATATRRARPDRGRTGALTWIPPRRRTGRARRSQPPPARKLVRAPFSAIATAVSFSVETSSGWA